jgi:hypothetical protein
MKRSCAKITIKSKKAEAGADVVVDINRERIKKLVILFGLV